MRVRVALSVGALTLSVLLSACSSDADEPAANASTAPVSPSTSASTPAPTSPTPSPTPSARPNPISIPALFDKKYNGGALRLEGVVASTDAYIQHTVSYRSGKLRISGMLFVPRGDGPFPALVLAHGYIDPDIYRNGQGLRREQDRLARAGYVVLHTDYRHHSRSSKDPSIDRNFRLGYTEDVINAVLALRETTRVPVADDRIGLLGRSMGGGIVYNVLAAYPGLVDAAVVYAPVSSLAGENFDQFIRDGEGRSQLARFLINRYGDPAAGGEFWDGVSPRTYFDRITEPVMIHHGTSDDSCPFDWSRQTTLALRALGVDVTFHVYAGEEHAFVPQWGLSMGRTERFLAQHLS